MKDHHGRSRLDANRRRARWHGSIVEAILEPSVDVLDELIRVFVEIFIPQHAMLPVRLDHNPLPESLARSCTGNSLVSGIDGRHGEKLVVCADDRQ